MVDHTRSALLSCLLVVAAIGTGQVLKRLLENSRSGNLVGGGNQSTFNYLICIAVNSLIILGLGAVVFLYTLTALSNLKMAKFGEGAKSGLLEVFVALTFGVITSASIHRVSATSCILFSLSSLVFLTGIAKERYDITAQQTSTIKKRK